MTEGSSKYQEKEESLLDGLVEKARQRFWSKRFQEVGDPFPQPYFAIAAAGDVVEEFGDPVALGLKLVTETSLRPEEIELQVAISDYKKWEDLLRDICMFLINQELYRRYPEIREEDDKRDEEGGEIREKYFDEHPEDLEEF